MYVRTLTVIAVSLILGVSTFAHGQVSDVPCALSDQDFLSLSKAKAGGLSREQVAGLSQEDQVQLCKARKLLLDYRASGKQLTITKDKVPVRMARFLTSEEYEEVVPIVRHALACAMEK